MSRPPAAPRRQDIPIYELEALDNLVGRFGGTMPEGYFGVLANTPPLGWRLASAGRRNVSIRLGDPRSSVCRN